MEERIYYIYNVSFKNQLVQEVSGMIDEKISDCATYIVPPEFQKFTIPVFDKKTETWDIIADYRNETIYNKQNSLLKKIQILVGDINEEYTLIVPPDEVKSYRLQGDVWVSNFQVTKAQLNNFTYNQKCNIAYTGINVVTNNQTYTFQTDQNSITMCNSQAIALSALPQQNQIQWKVYKNGSPVLLTLTKNQFLLIFSFGMQMINTSFVVQGALNKIVDSMTYEQLKDQDYINQFKNQALQQFRNINKTIIIEENIKVTEI